MRAMASQITSLTIVCPAVYSGADQRKHQSSTSLAFVRGIHRWPMNSTRKWPVTRKCFHMMTSSWKLAASRLHEILQSDVLQHYRIFERGQGGNSGLQHKYVHFRHRVIQIKRKAFYLCSAMLQSIFNANYINLTHRVYYGGIKQYC